MGIMRDKPTVFVHWNILLYPHPFLNNSILEIPNSVISMIGKVKDEQKHLYWGLRSDTVESHQDSVDHSWLGSSRSRRGNATSFSFSMVRIWEQHKAFFQFQKQIYVLFMFSNFKFSLHSLIGFKNCFRSKRIGRTRGIPFFFKSIFTIFCS